MWGLDTSGTDYLNYEVLKNQKLTIDSIFQVAFWDKIHVQQDPGYPVESFIDFPVNEDGIFDENDGEYEKEIRVSNKKLKIV